tara:strand:- start:322 stop:1896 length:1575 start_codon:yes stop_codon:yes gene_type:complete
MRKLIALVSSLLLVATLATPAQSAGGKYSVDQKTLATFSSSATTLTSQQKSQVKATVEANPTAEKFICTGIRYYSQPMSINIMVRKRAKAACEYAKQLNPELSTWYQNKPTQAKSYAGKVLLTVKSLEAPTVELTEIGLTAPTLSTSLGTVTVRWDGKYTNLNGRPAPSSSIFQTVDIFMSTSSNPLSSTSNKVADLSAGLEVLTGPTVQPCKTYYFALKSVIGGNTYASEPLSIQVDTVFGCDSSSGGSDLGYQQLNQEVRAASGMTVKVTQLALEPRSGSTRLNLTYVMDNSTSASEITEGSFKLFFSDGSSLNQYGFFNSLFPGDDSTRSYVFEWTGSKTPELIEYDAGFFQNNPGNGLKWQVTDADSADPTPTPTPTETTGQRNARSKAESYLAYSSFSRTGLIDQLIYNQFSRADAEYAVDAVDANWNIQAAGKAESYLSYSAFSRSGLVDQLLYNGFIGSEAEYGVASTNANWNDQAAKKAKSYLEYSSFSRQGLIDQLKYNGFSQSEAEYGVSQNGY